MSACSSKEVPLSQKDMKLFLVETLLLVMVSVVLPTTTSLQLLRVRKRVPGLGSLVGPRRQSFLEKRLLLFCTSLTSKVSSVLIEILVFCCPSTSQTVVVAATAMSRMTKMIAQQTYAP